VARNSVIMLTDQGQLNFTGDSIRGDGYYGFSDGLHTVQVSLNNFTGRIIVQGSLATSPGATDWFDIKLNGNTPYVQYTNSSVTEAFTFQGNIVYLRAQVDRSYITPTPALNTVGTIDQILLNI
jgi:hypothetical protein